MLKIKTTKSYFEKRMKIRTLDLSLQGDALPLSYIRVVLAGAIAPRPDQHAT